ncbi:MAG: HAD family hydrolase [Gemmatimonadetes bacterium]|nr:HAD family hydrolase [Gemmatimonadota bacterium]
MSTRPHRRRWTAILFDLDGTLIATRRLYLECYRRALAPCLGRLLSDSELIALKPRTEIRFLCQQVEPQAFAGCLEDFYRHYASLHDQLFEGVYGGVPLMLERLRKAGCAMGIVTGKSRRSWEITAARAGLGDFDVLVFDDEVSAPKPDPQGIRAALNRLGAPPASALYVGDSIGDMQAARAAGVHAGCALWRRTPGEVGSFAARAKAEGALLIYQPGEIPGPLPKHLH